MTVMSAAYMRQYRAALRAIREADGGLLPFQRRFVEAVCRQTSPPDIAVLSVPRGNGKSWLCGQLVARALTPGDPLFEPAVENVLVAASRPASGDCVGLRAGCTRGGGRVPMVEGYRDRTLRVGRG